jgi:hypothetical protein
MFEGISEGEPVMLLTETIRHLQADADHGNAHSIQSKMALASTYSRQQVDGPSKRQRHRGRKIEKQSQRGRQRQRELEGEFKGLQKNLQAIWNWFVIWDFLSGRCMRRL